jgi:hypothetical protein
MRDAASYLPRIVLRVSLADYDIRMGKGKKAEQAFAVKFKTKETQRNVKKTTDGARYDVFRK